MAGRYSKEYRPTEFVKLPFDDVVKAMALKEQQYQQGYLAPAAYQQEMSKVEVRTPDIEYHNQLTQNAINKARQLAEETYGGDYGAAAMDITKTLANEASNPFYSWTKSKMDEYKRAKDIEMKLKAEGKYIGFDEGLLNTSYYDKESNTYNTNLTTNLQEKLDYEKQREDIWNYAIQEEGGSYKGKLADAETQAKANKLFIEIPKSSWQGVTNTQVVNKYKGALAQYMSTSEYNQEKALLIKNGFSEEQADKQIASNMLKSGMLKVHMITKDDSQLIGNPSHVSDVSGGDKTKPIFDLMQKELPSTKEERDKAIEDSKKSNDARKANLEDSLSKAFGIKANPGVKFSFDNLTDYISDKVSNAQEYVEGLFGKGKTKDLSPLDIKINVAESKISKDPTFNNLKLTYPSIYKKAKLANKSINEFVDDVASFEAGVNAKPTVQYYTENDKFQKNLEEDLRRLNKNSEDKDIYDTTNGEYITFGDMLNVMDKMKKDNPDNPSPYKISTYKDGLAIIKGKDIYKLPKEYLSPERANALDLVSKAENIYRMYNSETGDAASGHVVRSNGINLYVLPGKGYIPISGNIPTSAELASARMYGYKNIRNITNDIMAMIAMSTVD